MQVHSIIAGELRGDHSNGRNNLNHHVKVMPIFVRPKNFLIWSASNLEPHFKNILEWLSRMLTANIWHTSSNTVTVMQLMTVSKRNNLSWKTVLLLEGLETVG